MADLVETIRREINIAVREISEWFAFFKRTFYDVAKVVKELRDMDKEELRETVRDFALQQAVIYLTWLKKILDIVGHIAFLKYRDATCPTLYIKPSDILYSVDDAPLLSPEEDVEATAVDLLKQGLRRSTTPYLLASKIFVVLRHDTRKQAVNDFELQNNPRHLPGYFAVRGHHQLWALKFLQRIGRFEGVEVNCYESMEDEEFAGMCSEFLVEGGQQVTFSGRSLEDMEYEATLALKLHRERVAPIWDKCSIATEGTRALRLHHMEGDREKGPGYTLSCNGRPCCQINPRELLEDDWYHERDHRCQKPYDSPLTRETPFYGNMIKEMIDMPLWLQLFGLAFVCAIMRGCIMECGKAAEGA